VVAFSSNLSSTNYSVSLSFVGGPSAGSVLWVTSKTTSGFTINAKDVDGPIAVTVDWIAIPNN
jgi:hypothetical protein